MNKTTHYPEKSIEQQIADIEKLRDEDRMFVNKLIRNLFIALAVVILGFSAWVLFLIYQ